VLRHPLVGAFEVAYETLRLPDDPDQALVTYTAEPGPARDALRLLLAAGVEKVERVQEAEELEEEAERRVGASGTRRP
jgi:MmyB-like transcription regulator ligand binding domain